MSLCEILVWKALFLRANGGGSHVRRESIREQNHLGHGAQMGCEVEAL